MYLIHARLQVFSIGIRIPAFDANKSHVLVSEGQFELSIGVSVSSLTAATRTIGGHLAKTQMLTVRWFESGPQKWVVLSYLKYMFNTHVEFIHVFRLVVNQAFIFIILPMSPYMMKLAKKIAPI